MKKFIETKAIRFFLFAFLLFAAGTTNAQIGIGIANPAASAQLDVSSTNKGFLPPRMTQGQRDAIVSPEAGLTVWCKDCGVLGELQVYNGFAWTNMTGGFSLAKIPATIKMGGEEWMTKNLDVTTYSDGTPIPQITDPNEWATATYGAWCYYNNDPANGALYGKLYNIWAVKDSRGLAPIGWSIPTIDNWTALAASLGGDALAGGKMKTTILWNYPNAGATNESNFTGLPAGVRNTDGSFSAMGNGTGWWTATDPNDRAYESRQYIFLLNHSSGSTQSDINTYLIFCRASQGPDCISPHYLNGYSVRCIKSSVVIGTQEWMLRNLDVSTYRDGSLIPQITDPTDWANATYGAWCYNDNDPANGAVYGKLYNWYATNDSRGLAPIGWHVPSDAEWYTLQNYLGGMTSAGGRLKEAGTAHWDSPNTGANNESGFTALPAGLRFPEGLFGGIRQTSNWWSSTESNMNTVGYSFIWWNYNYFDITHTYKKFGFSVRCIRN